VFADCWQRRGEQQRFRQMRTFLAFCALVIAGLSATVDAAACPPDYVAAPLLAAASALIGHARWAEATPGWTEPPHLWLGVVGDSGNGKSPGADCLMRDVLSVIERKMLGDFPDRLRGWRASFEFEKAAAERWQQEVR